MPLNCYCDAFDCIVFVTCFYSSFPCLFFSGSCLFISLSFYFSFFCLNTLYYNPLSVSLFVFSFLRSFFCPRVSPLRFVFVFPVYIIYDTVISFYGCRSFHWLSLLSFPLCSLSSFVSLSVLFLFLSCFSLSFSFSFLVSFASCFFSFLLSFSPSFFLFLLYFLFHSFSFSFVCFCLVFALFSLTCVNLT